MGKAKIDELKRELNSNRLDTDERIDVLISLSEELWKISEFSNSKKYAELALELAEKTDDKYRIASAYYLIGLMSCFLNNYDTALEYYYKSLRIHESQNLKQKMVEDLNNIGQIYVYLNNYDKAIEAFQQALDYSPDYARTNNNMSVVYNATNEHKKALHYAFRALELSKGVERQARSHIIAHLNVAEIYQKMDKSEEGLPYCDEALKLSKNRNDDTQLISQYIKGSLLKSANRSDEALPALKQALKMAKKHENKEYLKDTYRLLYEIYESQRKYKEALEHIKQYMKIERKIYSDAMADKIAKLQTMYEVETKELKAQRMAEKATRLASIAAMAAGITHEINQPLCAIKVSADSILYWYRKNNITLPQDFKEGLENISEAANRIDEIIQHMRSFWKLPDSSAQVTTIDLNFTIKKALGLIERQLYSHSIFLELDLVDEPLYILAEPLHIEQVFINIVVNAMNSLDEIDKRDKRIKIIIDTDNDHINLSVIDNGVGLPDIPSEKIFDPFYSTKKPGENMGLGLAIVKNYLDRYNASINAYNNKNGGATFHISFQKTNKKE